MGRDARQHLTFVCGFTLALASASASAACDSFGTASDETPLSDAAADGSLDAPGDASENTPPGADGGELLDASEDAIITKLDGATIDAGPPCDGGVSCPRYVFVTSAIFAGTAVGTVTAANLKCNTAATNGKAPIQGRTFVAWISTATSEPASDFVKSTARYRLRDETTVANSWNDLVDGNLTAAISLDENGATVSAAAWTGTQPNGTKNAERCNDWAPGGAVGKVGLSSSSSAGWTDSTSPQCAGQAHLYCFEK